VSLALCEKTINELFLKMKTFKFLLLVSIALLQAGCKQETNTLPPQNKCEGKLFIIGGGKRPAYMIDRLIAESGVDSAGFVLILPMASEEEDSAVYYGIKQFKERGVDSVLSINSHLLKELPSSCLQLIRIASLIYISGGDQDRFMNAIEGTKVKETLLEVYCKGATIAGTSAGAAVMSHKMITGNEIKHPVYTGDYKSIEANNIELKNGLGFLDQTIIDQHFIKRKRLNRMIAVSLENPESTCIGIDESTALLIKGGIAEVVGESQVIVLKHVRAETKIVNGLLGGKNMDLSVYLPGDSITIDCSLNRESELQN